MALPVQIIGIPCTHTRQNIVTLLGQRKMGEITVDKWININQYIFSKLIFQQVLFPYYIDLECPSSPTEQAGLAVYEESFYLRRVARLLCSHNTE